MPISEEKRQRYPADWQEIRETILEYCNHRCEGSPLYPECRAEQGKPHPVTGSLVVLTIAHLADPVENCDWENLRAWCQRCHLTYDRERHTRNRRQNVVAAMEKAGQLKLPHTFSCRARKVGRMLQFADFLRANGGYIPCSNRRRSLFLWKYLREVLAQKVIRGVAVVEDRSTGRHRPHYYVEIEAPKE